MLDIGAGSCPYRELFAHCSYKTQDFQGLESGQLRDPSGYGKIDYVCDAAAIPVPDQSFDAVLCTEVLEHVPEPIKVIGEIGRILKPGGVALLTAPLGSGLHQEPFHFYGGYTPFWYRRFLEGAGFGRISIEPNGGFFKHYGQESIRFARMSYPPKTGLGLLGQAVLFPLWILMAPIFVLVLPWLCHRLDQTETERKFTVGYHVVAVRK